MKQSNNMQMVGVQNTDKNMYLAACAEPESGTELRFTSIIINTITTVYTVPANKKAVITDWHILANSGTTFTGDVQLFDGTPTLLNFLYDYASLTAFSHVMTHNSASPIHMGAGWILRVQSYTATSWMSYFFHIWELSV